MPRFWNKRKGGAIDDDEDFNITDMYERAEEWPPTNLLQRPFTAKQLRTQKYNLKRTAYATVEKLQNERSKTKKGATYRGPGGYRGPAIPGYHVRIAPPVAPPAAAAAPQRRIANIINPPAQGRQAAAPPGRVANLFNNVVTKRKLKGPFEKEPPIPIKQKRQHLAEQTVIKPSGKELTFKIHTLSIVLGPPISGKTTMMEIWLALIAEYLISNKIKVFLVTEQSRHKDFKTIMDAIFERDDIVTYITPEEYLLSDSSMKDSVATAPAADPPTNDGDSSSSEDQQKLIIFDDVFNDERISLKLANKILQFVRVLQHKNLTLMMLTHYQYEHGSLGKIFPQIKASAQYLYLPVGGSGAFITRMKTIVQDPKLRLTPSLTEKLQLLFSRIQKAHALKDKAEKIQDHEQRAEAYAEANRVCPYEFIIINLQANEVYDLISLESITVGVE